MNKIALLFPGQGAQYVGMGKSVCIEFKVADHVFNQASETLGFDLKKMCFEGDITELTKTENAQPALLTTSIANYKAMKKTTEITPFYMAGHSLGEFSALVCAGAINFVDALKLVRKRGELMAKASEGGMAAIMGVDETVIREVCSKISSQDCFAVVSNNNSLDQIVISGHKPAISKVEDVISQNGGKVKILNVSAAFHSPLMKEAADEFKDLLAATSFRIPRWPVISNVTGRPITECSSIAEELYLQLVNPVQWRSGMTFMKSQNVNIFVDIGPGQVVKNLAVKNVSDAQVYAFDKPNDFENMKTQFPVSAFKPKVSFLSKAMAIVVCTKNNNFDPADYDAEVSKPYQEILNLNNKLEAEAIEPSKDHMQKAIDMLSSVFKAKKTSVIEQTERYTQLFDETDMWDVFPEFKMPGTM